MLCIGSPAVGVVLIIVLSILHRPDPELLEVAQTGDAASVFPDLLEDREKDGGKDRNDSDDDEQLNQREA